jgi:hypothetical protein
MENPGVFRGEIEEVRASLKAMAAGEKPIADVQELSDKVQYYYDHDEMTEDEYNELMSIVFDLNL